MFLMCKLGPDLYPTQLFYSHKLYFMTKTRFWFQDSKSTTGWANFEKDPYFDHGHPTIACSLKKVNKNALYKGQKTYQVDQVTRASISSVNRLSRLNHRASRQSTSSSSLGWPWRWRRRTVQSWKTSFFLFFYSVFLCGFDQFESLMISTPNCQLFIRPNILLRNPSTRGQFPADRSPRNDI